MAEWEKHQKQIGKKYMQHQHKGMTRFRQRFRQKGLNEIDDLWAGFFLGNTPLGFYSRAYVSSTYPRQIIATPITPRTVAHGGPVAGPRDGSPGRGG